MSISSGHNFRRTDILYIGPLFLPLGVFCAKNRIDFIIFHAYNDFQTSFD